MLLRGFVFRVATVVISLLRRSVTDNFGPFDGIVEIQDAKQDDSNVGSYLVCPDEHVDVDNPDKRVPTAGSSSSSRGIPPPQPGWINTSITSPKPGVLDTHDIHLGAGYEFNAEGHLCGRDTINRILQSG